MTTFPRFDPFERRIYEAIDEIAAARPPDYLTDILRQTARTSQRPRWTFLERWLPVDTALSRPGVAGHWPMRLLVGLALLAVIAAAAWAGSRLIERPAPELPGPFGPARNGLVAFSIENDIHLGDPVTGASRLFVAGGGHAPIFDGAGTRIATVRTTPGGAGMCYGPPPLPTCTSVIVVTHMDARATEITPPMPWPVAIHGWSGDGRWILATASGAVRLVAADGSGDRIIRNGESLGALPRFGAPDGNSIWLDEAAPDGGLRPIQVGFDGQVLTRFEAIAGRQNMTFDVSPDGRNVAIGGDGPSILIVRLDGSTDGEIDLGPDVTQVAGLAWSPDGRAIAVEAIRGVARSVLLMDPDGATTRSLHPAAVTSCSWAPDGGSLLCNDNEVGWWIVDREAGAFRTTWPGDQITDTMSWQRRTLLEEPE